MHRLGRNVWVKCAITAAALLVAQGLESSAQAAFDTSNKVWEGVTWSNADAAATAAEVSGTAPDDIFRLQRTAAYTIAANYTGYYADSLNAGGANAALFTSLNSASQPWVRVTYTDNTAVGASDLSFFVGGTGAGNPRFLVGAYFGNAYTAVQRLDGGTPAESVTYVGPNFPSFPASPRVNGDVVTITAGRLTDGRIEFTFQSANLNGGIPVTRISSYFNDEGVPTTFPWSAFTLRFRGNSDPFNNPVTFNNLEYGNNYGLQVPEPASVGALGTITALVAFRRRR